MKDLLKSELKTFAQYFALALIAGWLHFVIFFGGALGMNIREAWLNYESLLRNWHIIFVGLGTIRLIVVLVLSKPLTRI